MDSLQIDAGQGGKRYNVLDHMIKQNARGMPQRVQLAGCFWMGACAIVQIDTNQAFSIRQLRRAYRDMQRIECRVYNPPPEHDGFAMDANCFLYRPGLILSAWYEMVGQKRQFHGVYSDMPSEVHPYLEFCRTDGPVGTHFRHPRWDPWFPNTAYPTEAYYVFIED